MLTYHEYIETEDSISLVTELLENRSLADYLRSECFGLVSEEIARFMVKSMVKAVSYLHAKDIVHRDLKLENVLIDREYRPKLIDFGFARQLPKENYVLYEYCGTPNYMAPEIQQREGYYGKPADIWALGVIVYRMATGNFPFKSGADKPSQLKAMKSELRMPHELSAELTALLTQMLTFDFRKRPSAEEIQASEWLNYR